MPNLKKLKEADLFWRKAVLFVVLCVLAVPLVVLVIRRTVVRMRGLNSQAIIEEFDMGEMKEGLGQTVLEIQETREELQEAIDQQATTTGTSTDATNGTTTEQDGEPSY